MWRQRHRFDLNSFPEVFSVSHFEFDSVALFQLFLRAGIIWLQIYSQQYNDYISYRRNGPQDFLLTFGPKQPFIILVFQRVPKTGSVWKEKREEKIAWSERRMKRREREVKGARDKTDEKREE